MQKYPMLFALFLVFSIACGDDTSDADMSVRDARGEDQTTDTSQGDTNPSDTHTEDTSDDAALDAAEDMPSPEGWTLSTHGCLGNRTNALWRDDDGTLYVGCGENTVGTGVYVSTDEGATWAQPGASPSDILDQFRVVDISRSANGQLYLAGVSTNTAVSTRVYRADTSVDPWVLEPEFNATGSVGGTFTVGTYRRHESGRAIAESLTGHDLVLRDSDADPWQTGLNPFDGPSQQMLDMEIHEGVFYGAGSVINMPPVLLIEDTSAASLALDVITLGTYDGEMWSLDVDEAGIAIGGVDQDADEGWVYVRGLDGSEISATNVQALVPSATATWVRGVCKDGEVIVAVGEDATTLTGFVLWSDDQGVTWSNITPETGNPAYPYPTASECWLSETHLYVAGKDGMFAVRAR